jgi:type II secretory pathway pseudopilin PulG
MTKARDEQGFVLVAALAVLTVMMGLGLGVLLFANNQQRASSGEQAREAAFNLAEAALNAQVGQVSRLWPGDKEVEELYYPASCTAATSAATNGCPSAASLSAAYPKTGSGTCAAGTPGDAWGSSLSNQWTTYVRDDGPVGAPSPLFSSAIDKSLPTWDANHDGKVWVRSVGVVQCHVVALVTLVSQQFIATNFPHNAATGNWFDTSNNGNKVIVNTLGKASQAGGVSMRCTEPHPTPCKNYDVEHGQVSPDTTNAPPSPSPTYSTSQLATFKQQAQWAGTYYPAGSCPASLEATSGLPTYVEGPCTLSYTGGVANSAISPGFLIIANGTLTLNGNPEFYGAIYAVNQANSSGAVVTVHGTANVYGAIVVDGNGGIDFGSSAANLVYEPAVIALIKTYAGATPTRNSFRVLPVNQ